MLALTDHLMLDYRTMDYQDLVDMLATCTAAFTKQLTEVGDTAEMNRLRETILAIQAEIEARRKKEPQRQR